MLCQYWGGKPNVEPKIEVTVTDHDEPEEPEVAPLPRPQPDKPKIEAVVPKPRTKPDRQGVDTEPPPKVIPVTEPIRPDDCSMVTVRRDGGRSEIRGFVGTPDALEAVKRSHQGKQYDIQVDLRPWPQCEVLMTLATALKKDGRPKVSLAGGQSLLQTGDFLTIDVIAPKRPSYLYISYVQADGSVIHLQQPASVASPPSLSAASLRFGDGEAGSSRFVVSKPYGREMILAVSSASPLFDDPLPPRQTEREYLTALRKALIYKSDPGLPDREVTADFYGLETRERPQ